MTTKRDATTPDHPATAGQLRDDAEAQLARKAPAAGESARPAVELLHELQVHQIELEMQNEALREAQIALEESRDRYVDLYEFAPVGYLTLNREAQIEAINLTGATLLREDRKNLLHRRFAHFVVPREQERWQRHFLHALQHDGKQSCELSLSRRDGTVFVANLDCRRSVAGDAAPTLRLTLTDISERKQAEQALLESETRFRTMADAAPVLIWIAGVDQNCTWFNQQWLEFTGRTMAQELGAGWTASVHAEDIERCLRRYREAFERRESFEMEYRLRRADGKFRWVLDHGVPRYGADAEFLGYIGSCIDITRLKRAEEDLQRAQSVAHIGSWRFDAQQQRFTGSRETQRIFGVLDGAPMSYAAFLAQVHPDDRDDVDLMWQAGMRSGPSQMEHRLLVEGQVKWVRHKAEFEYDAQGELRTGFGITQDVTEIRQALDRLHRANYRLETLADEQAAHLRQLASELTRAEQRERDRLYELLHDEVQPLLVAARLSLSSLGPRTLKKDCLRVAAESCAHISQVIRVARTLSVQLSPPLIRERGLQPALESLCGWVKENHGLSVDLNCAVDAEPEDVAVRLLCFNAVRELLMNVVKHAGTAQVSVSLQCADLSSLRIVVADRGSGFDPALAGGGSGLAAIERRLSMIGGALHIDSRPGQGTVATLLAPRGAVGTAEWAQGSEERRQGKGEADGQDTDRR